KAFSAFSQLADVKREIIQTLRRIAARDDYLNKARQHFGQTLTDALTHPENTIRSAAVPAVTELYQSDVLPLLLAPQNFLLDDEDTSVRFAVAQAIQKYGQTKHLLILNNRLQIEPHPETAKALRDAFIHILETKADSIQDMAIWVNKLHHSNNNTTTELQLLHDQIVQTLWQKINQAKTTGVYVSPDFESLALTRLLNLDLPQETKDTYRMKLIQLSLIHPNQPDLLQQAHLALIALENRPAALDVFHHIEGTYNQFDLNEETTLNQAATIVTALICPLENFPTESLAKTWQKIRTQLALRIVDNQIKRLNTPQPENPSTIETLSKLDERLTGYPHDQPPQIRLDTLENFRTLLQAPDKTDTAASENINNM
ncbi:MAG: HEAT repeat domain-containing protein, partial [Planctomycetes bacterium]|nr:HEAT repeat domain-containing protein [Planctomycetota bacterium]